MPPTFSSGCQTHVHEKRQPSSLRKRRCHCRHVGFSAYRSQQRRTRCRQRCRSITRPSRNQRWMTSGTRADKCRRRCVPRMTPRSIRASTRPSPSLQTRFRGQRLVREVVVGVRFQQYRQTSLRTSPTDLQPRQ
jgi:hypothetical protein